MDAKEIVKIWLNDLEEDLIKNYLRLGLKASGEWGKSLEQYTSLKQNKITLGILGQNYTEYIENGRNPNKNKSKKAIKAWVGWAGSTFLKDWVKDKGLKRNPFAVAYKIAKEGWKVPNKFNKGGLVSDVVTKNRIDELLNQLSTYYIENFRSDIIKTFK